MDPCESGNIQQGAIVGAIEADARRVEQICELVMDADEALEMAASSSI